MSAIESGKVEATISSDVYRRLVLLVIVGNFQDGVYGAKRLEKVACISERGEESPKVFSFKRWHYGQFSDDLEAIKDQLLTMRYIIAAPLERANQGNKYILHERQAGMHFRHLLSRIDPAMAGTIDSTVRDYGYMPESQLVDICYNFPEFKDVEVGETIWESDLPARIPVPLDIDEADSLELSLNPAFVSSCLLLAEGLEQTGMDWEKVNNVEPSIQAPGP